MNGRRVAVRKLGYSHEPWRLVVEPCPAGDGHREGRCVCELWRDGIPFDHPNLGATSISGPYSYARKQDAVDALGEIAALAVATRDRQEAA